MAASQGANGSLSGLADMDYGELAMHAFGRPGWWAVQLAIVFSQVGFCCAYLIFITKNLETLIGELSQ
jgi:proton-coupled amino acid transporter